MTVYIWHHPKDTFQLFLGGNIKYPSTVQYTNCTCPGKNEDDLESVFDI